MVQVSPKFPNENIEPEQSLLKSQPKGLIGRNSDNSKRHLIEGEKKDQTYWHSHFHCNEFGLMVSIQVLKFHVEILVLLVSAHKVG